jgi:hypothetical protein
VVLAMLASTTPVVQVGITPRQVLRTKTFSTPFTVPARFEANDENAMSCPEELALGCSLKPLAGVTPSGVDTSVVDGEHCAMTTVTPRQVSRT